MKTSSRQTTASKQHGTLAVPVVSTRRTSSTASTRSSSSPVSGPPSRKNCSVCGRWRPITDYRPQKWNEDGTIKYVQAQCNPCHYRKNREAYHRLPLDVKIKRWEASREYHAVDRRANGKPIRQVRNGNGNYGQGRVKDASRVETLPAAPLVAWIEDKLAQGYTRKELVLGSGVSEKLLYRLTVEKQERVSLDVADKLLTHHKVPLSLVYPPE